MAHLEGPGVGWRAADEHAGAEPRSGGCEGPVVLAQVEAVGRQLLGCVIGVVPPEFTGTDPMSISMEIFFDAFEEVVVNTAGAQVDVGGNFGGTYNAIFKSGSNAWHGVITICGSEK